MLEGGGGAIKHLPHQEVTVRPKNTKQATPHHLHSSVQGNSTTGRGMGSQAVQVLARQLLSGKSGFYRGRGY